MEIKRKKERISNIVFIYRMGFYSSFTVNVPDNDFNSRIENLRESVELDNTRNGYRC